MGMCGVVGRRRSRVRITQRGSSGRKEQLSTILCSRVRSEAFENGLSRSSVRREHADASVDAWMQLLSIDPL
jgi:hypothetical protein